MPLLITIEFKLQISSVRSSNNFGRDFTGRGRVRLPCACGEDCLDTLLGNWYVSSYDVTCEKLDEEENEV